MRRHIVGIHDRDENAGVGNFCCVTAVAGDNPDNFCFPLFCEIKRMHDVHAHLFLHVSATNREHHDGIPRSNMVALEPAREYAVPPVVINARGKLGDIVGRSIGLNVGDFAEVIDRVGSVGRGTANAKHEEPPFFFLNTLKNRDDFFNRRTVYGLRDFRDFRKVLLKIR